MEGGKALWFIRTHMNRELHSGAGLILHSEGIDKCECNIVKRQSNRAPSQPSGVISILIRVGSEINPGH